MLRNNLQGTIDREALTELLISMDINTEARAEEQAVYKMDPIVVTAQREKVEVLEAIVVTASRDARVLVALK